MEFERIWNKTTKQNGFNISRGLPMIY